MRWLICIVALVMLVSTVYGALYLDYFGAIKEYFRPRTFSEILELFQVEGAFTFDTAFRSFHESLEGVKKLAEQIEKSYDSLTSYGTSIFDKIGDLRSIVINGIAIFFQIIIGVLKYCVSLILDSADAIYNLIRIIFELVTLPMAKST